MMNRPFVSICVLSYNRPDTLLRLLNTIDSKRNDEIEIVICEDCSPRQEEIREVIDNFRTLQKFSILYSENPKNLGYDGTLCELVKQANGVWLVFMGDDDEFVAGALDKVIDFLGQHSELGYILKSHFTVFDNQKKEPFRYFTKTVFFDPGFGAYIELFRKSVFIAGFIIRREYATPYLTDRFDGTLLIQLYLLAEVVMRYPSAYLDVPFTQQYASHEHNIGDVMFDREKSLFVPRHLTLDISLNFLKSFSIITEYIDMKHQVNSTSLIKKDMSKYFYPSLSLHRDAGLHFFFNYVRELNKLSFNASFYYYIYVILLTLFGKRVCDWGIYRLKKLLGSTPRL